MLVDPQDLIKRFAIMCGEMRKAFMAEGFTRGEAFELVKAYIEQPTSGAGEDD